MAPEADRPSQDQLRSLFNEYLTGARKSTPAPAPPPLPRPPKAVRPPPPPRKDPEKELLSKLNPAQLKKLKILKASLPLPKYRRILGLPELEKDPAAFFARWDRLLNGFGMRSAAAVLLNELKPEEACVTRLTQLLRCDPKESKALLAVPRFASLPLERRSIAIRDHLMHLARRWDCPPELVSRVTTGQLADSELAVQLLARKLQVDVSAAKTLLGSRQPDDPVRQALDVARKIQLHADERGTAPSKVVDGILEGVKEAALFLRSVTLEFSISEELAAKLCDRPEVRTAPRDERKRRLAEEVKGVVARLGCSPAQACRFLCGELPPGELDGTVGQAIASALGVEPATGVELGRHPELKEVPAAERAKRAVRRVESVAEELRCTAAEAAELLVGRLPTGSLAPILRARLALAEGTAEKLLEWARSQTDALADAVLGAIHQVEETMPSASCTCDQAALLVCGQMTLADLRASRLADELGIAPDLALKLVGWMDAEKVGEAQAKARIRNLRSWAADTMEQACRILIKEIPTPTKSDSDAMPFSGAWE